MAALQAYMAGGGAMGAPMPAAPSPSRSSGRTADPSSVISLDDAEFGRY